MEALKKWVTCAVMFLRDVLIEMIHANATKPGNGEGGGVSGLGRFHRRRLEEDDEVEKKHWAPINKKC